MWKPATVAVLLTLLCLADCSEQDMLSFSDAMQQTEAASPPNSAFAPGGCEYELAHGGSCNSQ